jgi:hypothetical protein
MSEIYSCEGLASCPKVGAQTESALFGFLSSIVALPALPDAYGWLYACRGLYQLKEYHLVIEGLTHCLRNEKTMKEAHHLLAFRSFPPFA